MSSQIYFDDLVLGQTERFGRYEVDRAEVIAFASKYDPQSFHLSDEGAAGTVFGRMSASALHTLAMTSRMMADQAKETGFWPAAGLGLERMRLPRPVFPGDVLSVRTEIIDLRPSASRPDCGIVSVQIDALNQDEERVLQYVGVMMFKKRAAA